MAKKIQLRSILQIIGGIAVVLTLVPFIAANYWWIRIFDFPHLQLTVFTLIALLVYFIRFDMRYWGDYAFVAIITGCFIFQLMKIYPYTSLAKVEALANGKNDPKNFISILTINVLEKNEEHQKVLDEIHLMNAEVVILLETNDRWKNVISEALQSEYPYKVEVARSNTYGMLVYSKYKLLNPEVKYLVDDEIPSIHSLVELPSGQQIKLHVVHPTPPMPQHNPSSTDRDAEMLQVAKMAKYSEIPVIVTGDLNDVAWSESTKLFQNVGGLLDPRVGRGLFNTYSADSWLLRWPLDHLFSSEEFRVVEIKRGNDVDSDHFPYYAKLSLEPATASKQDRKPATPKEMEEANEEIDKAE